MPAWIHNRAEHLLAKNPDMKKSTAFAIATQQGHKLGKNPKGYGTKQGKKEARQKYDKPRKEYVKGANPGDLETPKLPREKSKESAMRAELEKQALIPVPIYALNPDASVDPYGVGGALGGAALGGGAVLGGTLLGKKMGVRVPDEAMPFIAAGVPAIGASVGSYFGHKKGKKKWREKKRAQWAERAKQLREKTATTQRDNPYMLDQIGRPKTRKLRADAPDPKYRVKQAMIPTAGMGAQKNIMDPAKRLAESQKIGVPKMQQPKVKPLQVKMGSMAKGASGDMVEYFQKHPEKLKEKREREKKAFQTNQYSGNMGPGRLTGYAAGIPPFRVPPLGPGTKTAGPPPEEKAKEAGSWGTHEVTPDRYTAVVEDSDPVMAADKAKRWKKFNPKVESLGTDSRGREWTRVSIDVPRKKALKDPDMAMDIEEWDAKQPAKVAAMRDELAKLNAVTSSPQSKLYQSQAVGEPKVTAPPGPSIADQSKPIGFGLKQPGATKNRI